MNGMVWELAFGGMLLGLLLWELKRTRRSIAEDKSKAAAEAARKARDQDTAPPAA
ncbi:MAG: hypothetical protein JSS43_08510 [Proteobacteria bacterium]|nr:hypothetical protein [Pseudomonadota bacterium]